MGNGAAVISKKMSLGINEPIHCEPYRGQQRAGSRQLPTLAFSIPAPHGGSADTLQRRQWRAEQESLDRQRICGLSVFIAASAVFWRLWKVPSPKDIIITELIYRVFLPAVCELPKDKDLFLIFVSPAPDVIPSTENLFNKVLWNEKKDERIGNPFAFAQYFSIIHD